MTARGRGLAAEHGRGKEPVDDGQGVTLVQHVDENLNNAGTRANPLPVYQDASVFDEILLELKVITRHLELMTEVQIGEDS